MGYDILAAKKAGLSDGKISEYLANKQGYDLDSARKSGLAESKILAHLLNKETGSDTKQGKRERGKDADDSGEPAAVSQVSLRPAVRRTFTGKVGSTHPEVMEENGISADADHERGFVGDDGVFLTREEAKTVLESKHPEVYAEWEKDNGEGAEGELHSQDMNRAVETVDKQPS